MLTISPAVKALAHLVETRDVHVDQERRHHRPHHRQDKPSPGKHACSVFGCGVMLSCAKQKKTTFMGQEHAAHHSMASHQKCGEKCRRSARR